MIRLPENFFSLRPVRIGLLVLVALFLVYTACGFWLVPRIVRSNLVGFASEQYHRTATVGEIKFNPYNLVLEIRNFSMPDADGVQLLGFDRLLLNFDISSVWKVGASFADVQLDQPYVRVMLRPDGSLNLLDLANLANPPPPSDESPRVFIDRLSVHTGRVAFQDRARTRPFSTELRPINFELRDFSTGGESGNAYSLRAASVAGESFTWSGNFQLTPFTSNGRFEIARLQARTIWSYLSDALPMEFTRGVFGLSGEYFYTASEEGGLRFDVHEVSLTDFGMRPPGKDHDYIEVASLALEQSKVDLHTRRVDIGRVVLDGGAIRISRDQDANINLAELAGTATPGAAEPGGAAQPAGPPATTPPTPASAPPLAPSPPAKSETHAAAPSWIVAAPDIAVSALQVVFEDSLVEPKASFTLSPVDVKVAGYDTAPGTRFRFDGTAVGERTGKFRIQGETDAELAAYTAHVEASEWNLTTLQPYLSTYTQITLKSGMLNSTMDVDSAPDGAFKAKGEVTVDKLAAVHNALKQDLLKWDRLVVTGLDYGSKPERLAIARIDARAPYARLIVAPDQTLNITQLFTPAAGTQPAAVQSVRTAAGEVQAPGGNPGGMRVSIGAVRVAGGSANFADFWIKPNYAVSLQELNGGISGLSSDPKSRARVDLQGRVDRYAPAQISGEINLLSAALFTDLHVKFDGVEMTSVTPYSGRFAGYAIEKGKLSIDVSYLVQDRKLTAKQKFVIDQLQLGERVESADAVHLPLKLAVALLKDRNGVIDIDLPLTGSLDDPQFRMGPLIWKAFVGLLTKIATAPFALLARLGGSDKQINQVEFSPGSPALDAAAQESMGALAKALAERPSLEIEVPTAYAPDADGNAIAQARLDERLKTYGQVADGDVAARFDLLRKAFEKELGGKTPLPASATQVLEQRKKKDPAPDYEAANQELTAELLARHAASDAELGELARARADAIREALLASGSVEAKRVFVLGAKPVAAVDGRVRAELALK